MRSNPFTALCMCLALALAASPLVAAETATPTERELREQMTPVYQALQTDVQFAALRQQLKGNRGNREVIDRYLTYLPMSPMLMLEIDMHLKRYEIAVPRFIAEWHQRWIELHDKEARKMYGDAYVEARLNAEETAEAAARAVPTKTTVGTNRNVAATSTPAPEDYQGEIQVAANPNDLDEIVAAANTWDNMGGSCGSGIQAAFYSSDGGVTWDYSCPPGPGGYTGLSCSDFIIGSDPAVNWNDSDEVFLEYMLICTPDGIANEYAIVVAMSSDGGATWSGQGVVIDSWGTSNLEDKNFYAIDNNPSSPYYERHYTCWDRGNNEKSAYSSDNGATWTEVDLPTTTGSGFGSRLDLGCELAVEDDGTVHVVYDTLSCSGSTCNNEEMFYSQSTDGGATWSTPVEVHDFNLVGFSGNNCPDAQDNRCIGPMGAIDVDNSGGTCDGYLYATFGDYASLSDVESTDVYVTRSTDGGSTWSTPVMVNDDGLSGRIQFHPFLAVDQSNGYVVVAWHDARNDTGNDEVEYFVARSADCGASWETNIQISQASTEFNNSTIAYSNEYTSDNANRNPNQYGEYLGLDVREGKAYVAWTDTRHFFPGSTTESQAENVGFVVVDILPDVWSQDKPWDTGEEPDPLTAGNNMWESEDIWVRNDTTPGPHEDPEYGQVNYVWVNVRNRSLVPAYNMPIEVWVAEAATGLSWPADWTYVGTDIVASVPPGGVVQATVPWSPAAQGHHCLVSRHDSAQDPLTYTETTSIGYNTRYNNNIVWRNVNVVNLVTAKVREVWLTVRNISREKLVHNLVFHEGADSVFLERGVVTVHLPPLLLERWLEEGARGQGIEPIGGGALRVFDPKRSFIQVTLNKGEEFKIDMTFENTVQGNPERTGHYVFKVVQEEVRENGNEEAVGGVNYLIEAPLP